MRSDTVIDMRRDPEAAWLAPMQQSLGADIAGPVAATLRRLGTVLPAQAVAAADLLGDVLAPLGRSVWPEVAGGFSRLTNTGMPVEFSWSSREAAVRWTAEVAAPELADRERLMLAAQALDWQGDLTPWLELQRDDPLVFGAWASGRHGEERATKLYVDLYAGRLPAVWRDRYFLLRSNLLTWRLSGVNPDGSTEFYALGHELDRPALAAMARAVLGDAQPLMDMLEALLEGGALPRHVGISLALSADGQPRALSCFVVAKSLFHHDAEASAKLRSLADGVPAQLYEALASGPDDGRWRHGMIGVVADIAGRSWVQCGLRPT
ncbi:hypothetical protein [Lysobacter antibioticus]|uniref:Putative afsR-like transcriptional regulator n=1 Tax=Lysobacter antibioticus TaxID=84531 RepID=A0A0S2FG04_LYSAN|nr:hypothetical protein [Lysobacter antibioticus]ALN82464.1 putative afsR-like transcriptional regulator [Lysobacter antibioticus]